MTKDELCEQGKELMVRFCDTNDLPVPVVLDRPGLWSHPGRWPFDCCAYYREGAVTINVPRCSHVGGAVGRCWSYPGYFIDRTPYGVIQHELGHHVDLLRGKVKGSYFSDFSLKMHEDSAEKDLTGYAPNPAEWFAEMFRLFVTNPSLLAVIRPKTFKLLRQHFTPVTAQPWQQVLEEAPARHHEQCQKRIKETKKWT